MPRRRNRSALLPGALFLVTLKLAATGSAAGAGDQAKNLQPPPSVERAIDFYYHGDVEAAVDELQEVVAAQTAGPDARHNLALLLLETGRHAEAVASLNDDANAVVRATALVLAHQPERAMQTFEQIEAGDATLHFWRGLARLDAGDRSAAREAFEQAVEVQSHLPYGFYFLGLLALEEREWQTASAHFERALRLDASLTTVFEPLARARAAVGETKAAYSLITRAEIARPWDQAARAARVEMEREHPELLAAREAETAERRAVASAPRVAGLPAAAEAAPNIRVGLAEDVTAIHLKTGAAWSLSSGGEPVADGERDELLLVERVDSGGIVVTSVNSETLYRGSAPLELSYTDSGATTLLFDLEYGHGQFSAGREDRSYRGILRFLSWPDLGFTVVNELNLEAYLMSVVPSEMPAYWPAQALAAQAVAARSYTLAPRSRFHERGFDLVGSVLSAFYRGVSGEHPRSTEAVHSTIGRVLMDGETPLNAVYSANSAGYTESSASVWGFESALVGVSDRLLPPRRNALSPLELESWLRHRPDSHSNHASYSSYSAYRWTRWISQQELQSRLADAGLGSITALVTRGRGISGRVERVEVIGTEGSTTVVRDAIRSRLGGLRSNLFTVYPKLGPDGLPSHFVVSGAGWGHGVGMDQSGAAGMAAAGYSAAEILHHYYPRAELRTLY